MFGGPRANAGTGTLTDTDLCKAAEGGGKVDPRHPARRCPALCEAAKAQAGCFL